MYLEEGSQIHRAVEHAHPGLDSELTAFLEASGAEVLEGGQHVALDLDVQALAVTRPEEVPELLPVLLLVPPRKVLENYQIYGWWASRGNVCREGQSTPLITPRCFASTGQVKQNKCAKRC